MNRSTQEILQRLQERIAECNENEMPHEDNDRLLFSPIGDGVHIEFYGMSWNESFEDCLMTLCLPDCAEYVWSLSFRSPDEGANGTNNWDFSLLLDQDMIFPRLETLVIEPSDAASHNQIILGSTYDEEGQISRLLDKAPILKSLTVPSAPDTSFFERVQHPLQYLRVDSGYDTQNFILNFSQSSCFYALRTLDFGDYNQRNMPDYSQERTPFAHYLTMAESSAFADVGRCVLRNANLTTEQYTELKQRRKSCQWYVIEAPHGTYL